VPPDALSPPDGLLAPPGSTLAGGAPAAVSVDGGPAEAGPSVVVGDPDTLGVVVVVAGRRRRGVVVGEPGRWSEAGCRITVLPNRSCSALWPDTPASTRETATNARLVASAVPATHTATSMVRRDMATR
jgi:hypothetical protein